MMLYVREMFEFFTLASDAGESRMAALTRVQPTVRFNVPVHQLILDHKTVTAQTPPNQGKAGRVGPRPEATAGCSGPSSWPATTYWRTGS
jgi:hypothetical protein